MVEPAILKAVQGVEQRHVEEANHLPNGIDREQANNHTLENTTTQLYSSRRDICALSTHVVA